MTLSHCLSFVRPCSFILSLTLVTILSTKLFIIIFLNHLHRALFPCYWIVLLDFASCYFNLWMLFLCLLYLIFLKCIDFISFCSYFCCYTLICSTRFLFMSAFIFFFSLSHLLFLVSLSLPLSISPHPQLSLCLYEQLLITRSFLEHMIHS